MITRNGTSGRIPGRNGSLQMTMALGHNGSSPLRANGGRRVRNGQHTSSSNRRLSSRSHPLGHSGRGPTGPRGHPSSSGDDLNSNGGSLNNNGDSLNSNGGNLTRSGIGRASQRRGPLGNRGQRSSSGAGPINPEGRLTRSGCNPTD